MRKWFQTRNDVTKVTTQSGGYGFSMDPGVTILVVPDQQGTEWFAERLASILQDVACKEWT